jgi:predicted metal-dependent HD superfamily phosphohydrolase
MEDLVEAARHEWRQLMHWHEGGPAILQEVLASYAEPTRFYHTELHLAEMTMFLAEHRAAFAGYENILFACLYHDVVYDATKSDNEEQSAARWRVDAQRLGLGPEQTEQVSILIMATKKHQPANDSFDMQLFLDADLAVLGSDRFRYRRYLVAIRREYAHVAENAYREGRIAVLKKFLTRAQLYFSECARERHETQARKNLEAEIRMLERPDTFIGSFDRNASGFMTYEISEAPPEIFAELKSILREQFGFDTFAEPIEGPDQTVGTCSNGKVTLEWGHDSYSGFHFFSTSEAGAKLVGEIGEYINAQLPQLRFNFYRTYPMFAVV